MSDATFFLDSVRHVLRPARNGVVELADELLTLCQDREIFLDWNAGQCRVRSGAVETPGSIEVPLTKSVFRAILARLAALCNERQPGSVSPYGGEGELLIANFGVVCRVAFTNTPGEQRVRLTPGRKEKPESDTANGVQTGSQDPFVAGTGLTK
jgi:hypothetical protein